MHILMIHNYYQNWGGEDSSIGVDIDLLRHYGHKVSVYSRHNDEINTFSIPRKAGLLFSTTWSSQSYRDISRQIDLLQPDLVHFQNFFPLVSPSAYYACKQKNIPFIQTLHNFRLLCPMGMLVRDGKICEACVTGSLWNSIAYRCYRNSRIQTAAVALMLASHRAVGTWKKQVTLFTTPSEFARQKFIEAGLPGDKIEVRPHFLMDIPGGGSHTRRGALYVGRLSPEKGLEVLLEAWQELTDIPLKIIGDGPLRKRLETVIQQYQLDNVELVGFIPVDHILKEYQQASLVIVPSLVYETFGRTILEAYATETPVIASRIGAFPEIVQDQKTGMLVPPGDASALRGAVKKAFDDPNALAWMGKQGYQILKERYSAEPAYERLMEIYQKALSI